MHASSVTHSQNKNAGGTYLDGGLRCAREMLVPAGGMVWDRGRRLVLLLRQVTSLLRLEYLGRTPVKDVVSAPAKVKMYLRVIVVHSTRVAERQVRTGTQESARELVVHGAM